MTRQEPSPSLAGRIVGGIALGVGIVASVSALAAAAVSVTAARRVVTPSKKRLEDIRILLVTPDTITLSSTPDSRLPGKYSFWFAHGTGHARIGEILGETDDSVTRRLVGVDFGQLSTARGGYLAGWVYLTPDDLGHDYENVTIPTRVGDAPAWVIPAAEKSERWVIGVHGRGVRRPECLRAVDVTRRCGYNSLLVSYRNDGDAPPSDDGRYGLGDTEWQDVESAIEFAIGRGATEIVLMGWSMGGATVLQTMIRSSHTDIITGLILESPVIDWISTLDYQATALGLPVPLRRAAIDLIGRSWGSPLTGLAEPIDLSRLDFVSRASELSVPILLLHSVDDGFVPAEASRALAEARPDIVTYDQFTVARHTKLWNYDPDRWNGDIGAWLSRL